MILLLVVFFQTQTSSSNQWCPPILAPFGVFLFFFISENQFCFLNSYFMLWFLDLCFDLLSVLVFFFHYLFCFFLTLHFCFEWFVDVVFTSGPPYATYFSSSSLQFHFSDFFSFSCSILFSSFHLFSGFINLFTCAFDLLHVPFSVSALF